MTSKAFDQKLDALLALRNDPGSSEVVPQLRKALRDRSNYYVAKAAALVVEFVLTSLKQDLVDAFDRFLAGGAKLDPQCWAKQAIAEALAGLGHDDPKVFIKGTETFQLEPVWGGQQDTAIRLRGICTLALVQCKLSEHELLARLVDLLGDPEKGVRMEAIRAIGQCSAREAGLLLRVKATAGDSEADVIGQCLSTLLEIDADNQVGYVMRFLNDSDDLRFEALAALSECRNPLAANALIDALARDENHAVRDEIFQALGRSRHKQAIDFLADVIEDGNTSDAAVCIKVLAGGPQRDEIRERIEQIIKRRGNDALAKKFNNAFQ